MRSGATILAGLIAGVLVALGLLAAFVFVGPDPVGLRPTPRPSAAPSPIASPSTRPSVAPSPIASPSTPPSVAPSAAPASGSPPAPPSGSPGLQPTASDASATELHLGD